MNNAAVHLSHTPVRRILIIKLRHHGDMLLTTPVINTLHQHYPAAEIDVLLYQETRDMLAAHPAVTTIFAIDRQWKKLGTRKHLQKEAGLIRAIRGRHYDLVVNLADQWRSALITRLSGAPVRVGFDFPKRRHPLWRACHTLLASTEGHNRLHTVEQNLSILTPLGLRPPEARVTMSYTPDDHAAVTALLAATQVSAPYIVVQPTSRWFFKCWSEEKMAETLRALLADGHRIVLTSGPDAKEQQMIARIQALCPQPGLVSLAGQLTLRQLAALIDHARLFIGVDSVPMHMAAALGTPCLALFGPSKLTYWRPWQVNGRVIWAGDYGPLPDPDAIDTRTDERYLNLIPTDAVITAARELLS